jgi:hypothetical protein
MYGLVALPSIPSVALVPPLHGHSKLNRQLLPRALLGYGSLHLLYGLRRAEP